MKTKDFTSSVRRTLHARVHRPFASHTPRRPVVLALLLVAVLGAALESCAFLDLLTGLYTGTYTEYSACPLVSGGGCDVYDVVEDTEQWVDCHTCTIDIVFPPSKAPAIASSKQAQVILSDGLYWTENHDRILRTATGSSAEEIADFAHYPMGLTLDGTYVYWTDWRARGIRRATLDGSDVQDLVSGQQGLSGLALDAATQTLYWGDPINGRIQHLGLSGGAPADLITGLDAPTDLALDGAGKLYWIDNGLTGGAIRRANLDGSMVETVLPGLSAPFGLAIDPGAGTLYWSDMLDGAIRRANLDGTGQEDVLTGLSAPGGIALDAAGGKVYWVAMNSITVHRANLDGTGAETLTNGLPAADLALDLSKGHLYGTGWVSRTVWRSSLDGSTPQTLVSPHRISGDLALDAMRQKVYWAMTTTGIIQRANLDGSGVEAITDVQVGLDALAFDPVGDKLYWTSSGDVRRADPDGTNAETILSGIVFIGDLEVDAENGKLYWANRESIQRANLDGTGVETVYTDDNLIEHLAVHDGVLYWSVPFPDVIRRAALDGSIGVEDVVTGVNFVQQIDIAGDKLYWSLPLEGKIQRSNLDGTGVEDVLTNVNEPSGLLTVPDGQVPVELTSFEAVVEMRDVVLTWTTASETNNAGFEILQISKGREVVIGFAEGRGTTTEAHTYSFRVDGLDVGTYRFRLRQVDFDGAFEYSPEVEVTVELATAFAISPVYPNPFNPQARFTLTVAQPQHVQVAVYDLQGRLVERLHDGRLEADRPYTFTLDGSRWASGIYVYEAAGEHFRARKSALLIK